MNRILSDLVEHHALYGNLWLQDFLKVPSDSFAFAVLISCEIEFVGLFECLAKFGDALLLVGVHHVVGLEPRLNIHGEL